LQRWLRNDETSALTLKRIAKLPSILAFEENENEMSNEVRLTRSRTPILMTILHAILWLALLAELIIVVPRCVDTFEDFGVALPAAAQCAITLSNFAARYLWLMLLMCIPILLASYAMMSLAGRRSRLSPILVGLAMAAIPLSLGLFVAVGIGIPMMQLINNLS
jgi:type II secretory pathway component PulF